MKIAGDILSIILALPLIAFLIHHYTAHALI
jgi:hypothetical protein